MKNNKQKQRKPKKLNKLKQNEKKKQALYSSLDC